MATESLSERKFGEERWYDATVALLVGSIVFGGMVFHSLAVRMPKESPPVEAAPLVVITTAAAAISYLLLRRNNATGYEAAAVTGVLIVVSIGLVGTGVVGELKPATNPIGPLAYVALGVALFVTAVKARR